ncbi:MAG: type I glutamate--ammonia ligase [Legionella sp.]
MIINTLLAAIQNFDAKFIDLRFTDMIGKEQHITIPANLVDENFMLEGKIIDGSLFKGWCEKNQHELCLMPDLDHISLDPFYQENTIFVRCHIVDPASKKSYARDPRSIAQRAEIYLESTGIADQAFFGPEPEFFIFDGIRWQTTMNSSFYKIDSEDADWSSGKLIEGGNIGHRANIRSGYLSIPPIDSSQDIRSAIAMILQKLGIKVEAHYHERATANQCKIVTQANSLTRKADELQVLKYIVHNVVHNYGKTATFMPKPLVGEDGNGMRCHQSLYKDGINLFAGGCYAGLSELALYYIGGILKHAKALNAFTNPAINSYKRLVAPLLLAYSSCNRAAAIHIPYTHSVQSRRIEVCFPDSSANPYVAFAAILMAGLDGIQQKIDPGQAMDNHLSTTFIEHPTLAHSLQEAVSSLQSDHDFLLQGDVFSEEFIKTNLSLREQEIDYFRTLVHPYEFELYYSL